MIPDQQRKRTALEVLIQPGNMGCMRGCGQRQFKFILVMLFYIKNDDKLCFFLRGMYFSFLAKFLCQVIFTTNNNFNSPSGIYASGKCIAQNWHIHLTSRAFEQQCPVGRCRIVKYGPVARAAEDETKRGRRSGKSYEKENILYTSKGYLLEIRKVSPKPHCILMAASTLSVEYARLIKY